MIFFLIFIDDCDFVLVGYARNRSIEQSKGEYLCFQDVDDIMLPGRIRKQYEAARKMTNAVSCVLKVC